MLRGIALVTAVLVVACGLTACAEEEKPIEVPGHVRDGITAVLTAADPAAEPAFEGETCNTDPLADPPDDHRWRMTAEVGATPDEVRAAATKLGWQPERAEDGTLLLTNWHQFGEPLTLVVLDGRVTMFEEKDCTGHESTDQDYVGDGVPEPTSRQGDRLEDVVDTVDDALASINRDLKVRPKEGVYVEQDRPGGYFPCDAGDRTGALWQDNDAVYAEATSDDDLGPAADRLVDAVDGWRVTERVADTDDRGYRDISLALESKDGSATLDVRLSFWGTADAPDGVRLHVSRAKTTCVAVDNE